MDDPILPNPPAEPTPAPAAPVQDMRMERLESAMADLTETVRDAAQRLTAAPQQAPQRSPEDFLNDLASDPQGAIQRIAADTFRKAANETLNPAVLKVLETAKTQLLERHQGKVDAEFGEGTFDDVFRPQLEKDLSQLRTVNPSAMADPATMEALVNRLYGGDNFPVLLEKRKGYEKMARDRGMGHLIPGGGVPRLRAGQNVHEEIPSDAETFLREVERATGESIDRKEYAKLYHTGTETGPGRHRTNILEYLKVTGASPDKVKMYGGERS